MQTASIPESVQRQAPSKYIASTPSNATISRQPPLDISTLLQPADVHKIFGQKQLNVENLVGQPAAADYNALRIVADNSQETTYGVGLQVWNLTDIDAAKNQLNQLKGQYLGVQEIPVELQKTAASGFISERGGIRNYLMVVPPSNVLAISCEKSLCPNWSDLVELANIVQSRIGTIGPKHRHIAQ